MFTPLNQIAPTVLRKAGLGRIATAALVCEAYRKIAPEVLHKDALAHTSPRRFKNGTLTIATTSSSWAHVINEKKAIFLEKMKASLPDVSVKNIRTTPANASSVDLSVQDQ